MSSLVCAIRVYDLDSSRDRHVCHACHIELSGLASRIHRLTGHLTSQEHTSDGYCHSAGTKRQQHADHPLPLHLDGHAFIGNHLAQVYESE